MLPTACPHCYAVFQTPRALVWKYGTPHCPACKRPIMPPPEDPDGETT